MRIHVVGVAGRSTEEEPAVRELFQLSGSRSHELVPHAEDAEMILVAGRLLTLRDALHCAPLLRFPEKTLTYSEADHFIPYAPGVYGSAGKTLRGPDLKRTRSFPYISSFHLLRNQALRNCAGETKDLLFCFRGQRNCYVRSWLFQHDFGRSDVLIVDTSRYKHFSVDRHRKLDEAQLSYADTLARSHFALCPRGAGFGSIRLFEVMEMGIAPVLLSDRYALPHGPDWDSFLIQVPEREYARLPEILEPRLAESAELGRRARLAWEQFFAPEVAFDRLIGQLDGIRKDRVVPERLMQASWPFVWAAEGSRKYLRDKTVRLRSRDRLLTDRG